MSGELLVDLNEAAKRLALSRRNVQELVSRRSIPSVKIGRCRRVAVVDLERFVEALRNGHGALSP